MGEEKESRKFSSEEEMKDFVFQKFEQAKIHFGERDRLRDLQEQQDKIGRELVIKTYEKDEDGDENEVTEYIRDWLSKEKEFERLGRLLERFENTQGSQMRGQIRDIFLKVFKDIRAQTKVVTTLYSEDKINTGQSDRAKITIGKCGFGIRYNIQAAKPDSRDLAVFVERKDDIIAGLKSLKLKEWADRFERFVELMPEVSSNGSIKIEYPLSKPVVVAPQYSSDRIDECDRIVFCGDDIRLKSYKSEITVISKGYSEKFHVREYNRYGTVLLIKEDVERGLKLYNDKLEEQVKVAEESFEKIRQEFAMELMLAQ